MVWRVSKKCVVWFSFGYSCLEIGETSPILDAKTQIKLNKIAVLHYVLKIETALKFVAHNFDSLDFHLDPSDLSLLLTS